MLRRDLTPITVGRTCIHRLLGPRVHCPSGPCTGFGSALPWADHDGGLYRAADGSLVFACNPYLSEAMLSDARAFAAAHGLELEVSAADSFHAPGESTLLAFTRRPK